MTQKKGDESRGKQPTSAKHAVKAFFKEFAIVFGAFLVLNSFVLASFEVPTGSMENEIMTGDFLLVNKFVFGGTTPKTIPFTSTRIPSFKLPALWRVERGDVIVFSFPGNRDEVEPAEFAYYLKRCVALAGDTLQIINKVVFVNGNPTPAPRNVRFLNNYIKPAGIPEPGIFPMGSSFNGDNFGPIIIPKRGQVIPLQPENFAAWETFIRREGHAAEMRNGTIRLDGKEQTSYIVERDYVFGMGDNRDNSLDGRFWGFIPEESVVGTPLIVYWSWDPDLFLFDIADKFSSVRLGRIGTIVR